MTQVPSLPKSFYFVAGEASGDLLGAETIAALRDKGFQGTIRATGGKQMGAVADLSGIDVTPLSVLGLWEGLRAYGDVTRLAEVTSADVIASGASHLVLVDSWGFCLRVAQKVRAANPGVKLIKLIGPQVWATRAGRARTLANAVDQLLCMHEFEVPYYDPFGLDVRVIGHPALSRAEPADGGAFRETYDISPESRLVLVLPGSRPSEIERVAPPLIEAGRKLGTLPDTRIIVAPAGGVLTQFQTRFPDLPKNWICLADDRERFGAMAAADIALACSGTVTSEIAVQGTPFVTGYRTGIVTWTLVKHVLMKAEFITLLNMAASRMVAPELLQSDFNAQALLQAAALLLNDDEARSRQVAAQNQALVKMGFGGQPAADRAADVLLEA
ncbi:MAG: lipid-A-disaccharide synthase [Hyphomonadaceae bacterium]